MVMERLLAGHSGRVVWRRHHELAPAKEPEDFPNRCPALRAKIALRPRELGGFGVRRVLPGAERRTIGPFIYFDLWNRLPSKRSRASMSAPTPHIGLASMIYVFDGDRLHRDSPGSVQPASRRGLWLLCSATVALTACEGPQSALGPSGLGAERLAQLFWIMLIGAAIIWTLVIGFAIYVARLKSARYSEKAAYRLIVLGGVALPVTVLAALLAYGLILMPDLRAGDGGLRIAVSGERWWWHVEYFPAEGGSTVTSANELRLPVGQRAEITLTSPGVIHSFWIPPLGGKLDMIPGRTNRLVLEATETGIYRGQCAEFCGTSHALMAFAVVVMEPDAFAAWLAKEARPAATPDAPAIRAGRDRFLATGCGACHTIRGTPAAGVIGPDLTHVGGRLTLGAGTLPNDAESFAHWIADTQEIKPGVLMPSFGMLPDREIRAIAAYLDSLK